MSDAETVPPKQKGKLQVIWNKALEAGLKPTENTAQTIKIANERLKLSVATMNSISLAIMTGSFISPLLKQEPKFWATYFGEGLFIWTLLGFGLHLYQHRRFGKLQEEV